MRPFKVFKYKQSSLLFLSWLLENACSFEDYIFFRQTVEVISHFPDTPCSPRSTYEYTGARL